MQSKQNPFSSLLASAHVLPIPSRQTSPKFVLYFSLQNFPLSRIFSHFEAVFSFFLEIISRVLCLHEERVTQELGMILVVRELKAKWFVFEKERIGMVRYFFSTGVLN